jgi:neutral ceramidase
MEHDLGSLFAGVGRRPVTPPLGIKTAGFYSREGVVTGHDGALTATVCVLRGRGRSVVIAALDLCMAPQPLVAAWRASMAEVADTTADHVLVNLSHTHSSGALAATQPEFAFQREMLEDYEAMLGRQLVAATTDAVAGLRPGRIGADSGRSQLGIQRREMDADGYVFLGEVPDGPIDPVVGVVRVDDLDGRPIAILAAYGCHTVTVGPRASVASADFPGPMRELVERTLGGTCLFLQGGGGDIMPCWGMGHEADNQDGKERIGWMLGGEVVAVAAGIRTHVRRGERVSIPSLLGPGQTMRPLVPVEGETCSAIGARSRSVGLDLVALPSLEQAMGLRAEREADLEEALSSGSERAIQIARHFVAWAEILVAAVREGRRSVSMEVQALRINDIVLTGIAAEAFSSTTRAIREASPFASTLALGYSNGVLCYLPTADAYPAGGWDVADRYRIPDMVFQSYLLPVALAPDSESRIRAAALDLVAQLSDADA